MKKKLSLKELFKLAKGTDTDCCDKETSKKSCCTSNEVAKSNDTGDNQNKN